MLADGCMAAEDDLEEDVVYLQKPLSLLEAQGHDGATEQLQDASSSDDECPIYDDDFLIAKSRRRSP